jgi:hypothetical protein
MSNVKHVFLLCTAALCGFVVNGVLPESDVPDSVLRIFVEETKSKYEDKSQIPEGVKNELFETVWKADGTFVLTTAPNVLSAADALSLLKLIEMNSSWSNSLVWGAHNLRMARQLYEENGKSMCPNKTNRGLNFYCVFKEPVFAPGIKEMPELVPPTDTNQPLLKSLNIEVEKK